VGASLSWCPGSDAPSRHLRPLPHQELIRHPHPCRQARALNPAARHVPGHVQARPHAAKGDVAPPGGRGKPLGRQLRVTEAVGGHGARATVCRPLPRPDPPGGAWSARVRLRAACAAPSGHRLVRAVAAGEQNRQQHAYHIQVARSPRTRALMTTTSDIVLASSPAAMTIVRDEDGNVIGASTGLAAHDPHSFCDRRVYPACCDCEGNPAVRFLCICCGFCAPFCCGLSCAPKDSVPGGSDGDWLFYFRPLLPCGLTRCGLGCSRQLICYSDYDG
jgi:hypothetical protein